MPFVSSPAAKCAIASIEPGNGCTEVELFSGVKAPTGVQRLLSAWLIWRPTSEDGTMPNQTASELPSCGYTLLVGVSRYRPVDAFQYPLELTAVFRPAAFCVQASAVAVSP